MDLSVNVHFNTDSCRDHRLPARQLGDRLRGLEALQQLRGLRRRHRLAE